MSNTEATRKQLKIKAGVVKRYQKEITLYGAEVIDNKKRLESATAAAAAEGDGEESWDIKNAKSLIRESETMVLDTADRLKIAVGELGDLVKRAKENAELEKDAELLNAEKLLAVAPSV